MKKHFAKKGLVAFILIAIIGFGAYGYADWEMGMHGRGMGHGWSGSGHRGSYGYDGNYDRHGFMGNLSEDEIRKLDQAHNVYLKTTERLRQDIYQKQLALRSEMAKENPDANKAASLQKEISDLDSQLNQKGLDFELKMRKINPNFRSGYMCGYMGRGNMMGYGPRGSRRTW